METIEQPLSKSQRVELEGIVASSTQIFRAIAFLASIACVGSIYICSGKWTGGPRLRKLVREDLAAGCAIISILEPESVQEVEEIEDEGPAYIVRDVGGETFLLSGQEMCRYKSKKFPWSKIGVVETVRSKRFLGLKKMGDSIPVTDTRPPFTYDEAKRLGCFENSFVRLDAEQESLLNET